MDKTRLLFFTRYMILDVLGEDLPGPLGTQEYGAPLKNKK